MPIQIIVIEDLLPAIEDALQGAGEQLAKLFIDKAYADSQVNVAVDTGDLKASGHVEDIPNGYALIYDAVNTTGYAYGHYLEYGTRYMGAQPFIVPAFETALGHLMNEAPKVLEGLLT